GHAVTVGQEVREVAHRATAKVGELRRSGELAKGGKEANPDHTDTTSSRRTEGTGRIDVIPGQGYRRTRRPGIVTEMPFIALLSDRGARAALPALEELRLDVKTQPLASTSIAHVLELGPDLVLVDASENPGQGFALCRELAA